MLGLTSEETQLVQQNKSLEAAFRIMEFAQRSQGATVEELLDALQIPAGTFHPRLYELQRTGCLCVVGKRKTRTGRLARVYKLTPEASFPRYLEFKKLTFARHKDRAALTDIERVVLDAGLKALAVWNGNESQRRNAIITLVRRFDEVTRLVNSREKGKSYEEEEAK